MVNTFATLATVAVAATMLQVAEAHSNMVNPAPKWPSGFYNGNSPIGTVDSTKFQSTVPGYQGVKKVNEELGSSSLRDFVYQRLNIDMAGANRECGKTLMDGPTYDVPDEIDFPWGHLGPCEAWCDDTKIFFNADCQNNGVGKIKVDKSKCANAKRLQVMYLGVHVEAYQYYVNCVPLKGSGGGSAPAPAPAPIDDPAPAPQPNPTPAPQPNPVPTPSKNNCARRLRK